VKARSIRRRRRHHPCLFQTKVRSCKTSRKTFLTNRTILPKDIRQVENQLVAFEVTCEKIGNVWQIKPVKLVSGTK